jgi:hypothetical protein
MAFAESLPPLPTSTTLTPDRPPQSLPHHSHLHTPMQSGGHGHGTSKALLPDGSAAEVRRLVEQHPSIPGVVAAMEHHKRLQQQQQQELLQQQQLRSQQLQQQQKVLRQAASPRRTSVQRGKVFDGSRRHSTGGSTRPGTGLSMTGGSVGTSPRRQSSITASPVPLPAPQAGVCPSLSTSLSAYLSCSAWLRFKIAERSRRVPAA